MKSSIYIVHAKYFLGALYSQQSIQALVIGVFRFPKVVFTGLLWVLLCVLVAQSTRKTFSIVVPIRLYEKTSSNFLHFHAKDTRNDVPFLSQIVPDGTGGCPILSHISVVIHRFQQKGECLLVYVI